MKDLCCEMCNDKMVNSAMAVPTKELLITGFDPVISELGADNISSILIVKTGKNHGK